MVTNYLHALTHMLDITGRTDRRSYWYFILMVMALSCLAIFVDSAIVLSALTDGAPEIKIGTMTMTFGALHFLPIFSASVRRLHDVGKSGMWIFSNCALCRQHDPVFLVCPSECAQQRSWRSPA